jgi:hypothetical protein
MPRNTNELGVKNLLQEKISKRSDSDATFTNALTLEG